MDRHQFSSLEAAEAAVAMGQMPVDELQKEIQSLLEVEQRRLETFKTPIPLLTRQAEIDLCDKYVAKARKAMVIDARADAAKSGLRRPWDGPNGRAFRLWQKDQENLLEELMNPDSGTPLSESLIDVSMEGELDVDMSTADGIVKCKVWEKM